MHLQHTLSAPTATALVKLLPPIVRVAQTVVEVGISASQQLRNKDQFIPTPQIPEYSFHSSS
jgi:hypothetical protein